ncbi:hypothetical protein L596_003152 [Steinernema carpocapsae]|uniref:Major facilitator superfamily (MFS) profile domain-containing protein n=1 Tax=Steinernema carpocapsae TaxID=34508 RepID=A0A4U8UT99_STECR|nr:hypothetical protein L596_003152 [Steinernema carpocapsae]
MLSARACSSLANFSLQHVVWGRVSPLVLQTTSVTSRPASTKPLFLPISLFLHFQTAEQFVLELALHSETSDPCSCAMISTANIIKLFVICSILTSITNFPSGFTNSSVNTAVNELKRFINESYTLRGWNIDETGFSLIRSTTLNCWFVAQVFGAVLSPIVTDLYGRKLAYLYSTAVMTVASALQYVATITNLPELLIVGRSLTALCSPLSDAALILYLQECSPIEFRGMFSFLGEIGYGSMCVLGMVMGMNGVLGDSLPRLLGVSIIPGVFSILFLFFIPDTPKFLMITRNNRQAALKSLEFFQGAKKENEKLLEDYLREANNDDSSKRSSIKEIFTTWHLRHAVFLACAVLVLTLSFYPILQSSTYFFISTDIPSDIAEASSTLMMVVFTLSCMMGTFFIDRYPRRFLVITFGAISNFFLCVFVVCAVMAKYAWWVKYGCLASLFSYAISFGMVLGPISWFVAPELVAQRHRSNVFCLCYAINNVLIAITNFITVPSFDIIGAYTLIPLFIIPSCLCLVFIYFYLPETLGRETHEIVASMRRKRMRDVESRDSDSNLEKY